MAATATASSGPRYAPEDPTLPKPWKGLVDGKTGYLYFWNPETNVTQYDRPTSSAPPSKASSAQYISSSVQVQQSSQGQRRDEGDDRYGRGSNGGSKFEAGPRNMQVTAVTSYSYNYIWLLIQLHFPETFLVVFIWELICFSYLCIRVQEVHQFLLTMVQVGRLVHMEDLLLEEMDHQTLEVVCLLRLIVVGMKYLLL